MTIKTFGDLARHLVNTGDARGRLATSHAKLRRGIVWCRKCGSSCNCNMEKMRSGVTGWPKCCGLTMTIDSPEEQ